MLLQVNLAEARAVYTNGFREPGTTGVANTAGRALRAEREEVVASAPQRPGDLPQP
jgi:hypothetical protein